ncbi:MAG: hypothetical protein L0331_05850 [Chloroflexi bacterium]|nr:hypothetical protein [Chloroflexota bacterium]
MTDDEQVRFVRGDSDPAIMLDKGFILGPWGHVLGSTGVALYALYKCLADSRATASLTEIESHLALGRKTIYQINRLMIAAGLLEVEPGNNRYPNQYLVFSPPRATPALLAKISGELLADNWFDKEYNQDARDGLLARLRNQKPLGLVVRPLVGANGNGPEPDRPEPEPAVPAQDVVEELVGFGFDQEEAEQLAGQHEPDHLREWMDWIDGRENIDDPLAYLRKVAGQRPPRRGRKRPRGDGVHQEIPDDLKDIIKK